MTSKQEKLAAARRKLKEFQVKNKETDVSKHKNADLGSTKFTKDSVHASNDSLLCTSPAFSDNGDGNQNPVVTPCTFFQEKNTMDNNQRKISFLSESNSPKPWSDGSHSTYTNINSTRDNKIKEEHFPDYANGLNLKENTSDSYDIKNNHTLSSLNMLRDSKSPPKLIDNSNEHTNMKIVEAKDFFNSGNQSPLDDLIKPLQMELQNHAQTITILVQQRNDVQNSLTQTQNLLAIKSGEVEELSQKMSFLTSSINYLNKRLSEGDEAIKTINTEKEEILKKWSEARMHGDKLQGECNSKEEELSELRKKYEDKCSESQRLLFDLQEAQSQLSLSQIQIQQFSTGEHSGVAVQLSELQNENLSLKDKIVNLEKKLETENVEKEQSSLKFQVYAQQCGLQLNSLNSQLSALREENDKLSQENTILSKNLSEEERMKEKTPSSQSFEDEIADLHSQLSALTGENHQLQSSLKKKEEETAELETQFEEKESELKNLSELLKELQVENKKLIMEAETPKANERLLASMESDKVAAAKAVSQNQKLKEQIVELEKAFMKMSQEKLELTDQLAHEKHVNSELQNLLKNAKSDNHDHHEHHEHHHHDHHDHHDHNNCSHDKPEPLVNDSDEVEELRNIIRQLQDDKIELKARLSSFESNKVHSESRESDQNRNCDHDHGFGHGHQHEHKENETQCEDTKLLLQQMEEKVRKTMNEIAILDEEKEKLEHLVLQLQGETETIGEYITLYQKQRMLLRQRAQEKDSQLEQLSKDKEELKSKLVSLDELVQKLIAERKGFGLESGAQFPTSPVDIPDNTAGKIRALISEIGSTTLINNHPVIFEHCSCCSGRLITI